MKKRKKTKKIIHIMTTTLCARNCKYCCNKQYDLNVIPYVTDEELRDAETICLTGGEPFLFSDPCAIASYYKSKYKNIKNVYVYTNAIELNNYLKNHTLDGIDGLSVSLKGKADLLAFNELVDNEEVKKLTSNWLYEFE